MAGRAFGSATDCVARVAPTEMESSWAMYGELQEVFIPVHGFVSLTRNEVEVINHPAFQRLRRTRQLGFAHFVFPGAVHTRFEHSVGAVHVAERIIEHVNRNGDRGGADHPAWVLGKIDEPERLLIRLAALLHDIGHLPFGHTLEDELLHLPAHDDLPQTWAGPDEEPGEASLEAYTRTAPRRLLAGTRGRP